MNSEVFGGEKDTYIVRILFVITSFLINSFALRRLLNLFERIYLEFDLHYKRIKKLSDILVITRDTRYVAFWLHDTCSAWFKLRSYYIVLGKCNN